MLAMLNELPTKETCENVLPVSREMYTMSPIGSTIVLPVSLMLDCMQDAYGKSLGTVHSPFMYSCGYAGWPVSKIMLPSNDMDAPRSQAVLGTEVMAVHDAPKLVEMIGLTSFIQIGRAHV